MGSSLPFGGFEAGSSLLFAGLARGGLEVRVRALWVQTIFLHFFLPKSVHFCQFFLKIQARELRCGLQVFAGELSSSSLGSNPSLGGIKGRGRRGRKGKKECPFVQFARKGNPSEWSEALFSSFHQAY